MKKFFYTNGKDKIGPFSFEELKEQNLTRDTKVWFYGLEKWTTLSEIEELNSITNTIPPKIKTSYQKDVKYAKDVKVLGIDSKVNKFNRANIKSKLKKGVIFTLLVSIGIVYFSFNNYKDKKLYKEISSNSYDADVDFEFYVKKFYRDVEVYGIFPKKPKTTVIKFAKLDQLDNTTHIHGISFGINDDDRIEIYINPSTWESFNKPMKYYLMYHELSHDVLNVEDLKDEPNNEGALMYPAISSYESKTMDDFIESSHELFEQIAKKQNY